MKKIVLPVLVTGALMVSCSKSEEKKQDVSSENTEMLAFHQWEGTYEGVVPCASCEGIKKELIVKNDNTFTLTNEYLGEEDGKFEQEGSIEWDTNHQFGTFRDTKDSTNVSIFRFENGAAYMVSEVGEMEVKEAYKLTKK